MKRSTQKLKRCATMGLSLIGALSIMLMIQAPSAMAEGLGSNGMESALLAAANEDGQTADAPLFRSRYAVTITNLTYDQIISPPVVITHNKYFRLFEPGQPASMELTALAEDGMTGPLAEMLEDSNDVYSFGVASGGIPPGGSITVELDLAPVFSYISLAGMLVSTNDAFVAVNGMRVLPPGLQYLQSTTMAAAYDAGSEANTEMCDHIPGPPCGNPEVRVTDGAEGFVHVHRGIKGIGDLDPSMKDWNNPVALVTFERLH